MKNPEHINNTVGELMRKVPLWELFRKREDHIFHIARYFQIDVNKALNDLRKLKSCFLGE